MARGPTRRASALLVPAGLCCLLAGCGRPDTAATTSEHPAGSRLSFALPAPGTYRLPPIQPAADGAVVDADGSERRLYDYLGDKQVLLSFIYTHCSDPTGCPLASAVFRKIDKQLRADPDLGGDLRLVTLSFDPGRDDPERLLRYRGDEAYLETPWKERPWTMLTTAGSAELDPILEGYGQYVVPEIDESGQPTDRLAHVLKVFLIDRQRRVRNIYSSDFFEPEVAIHDVRTLVMEEDGG